MTFSNTAQALMEMDRAHALHPFAHFESFNKDGALVIMEGSGARIRDATGREYFDAVGGLWCTNIGLGRDEMADAIADQVRKLSYSSTFGDMTNETSALLVSKLAELTPKGLDHIHFTTGGSTAIDTAVRMVHYYQASRGCASKKFSLNVSNSPYDSE